MNRDWLIGFMFAALCQVLIARADDAASPPAAQKAAFDPAKLPKSFECRWANEPITIDGTADEPAWKSAQVIDNFYLPWLGKDARLAKTATKARLLWDREYLYFFAELEDHDLFADVTEHDGPLWNNDVFELFFKPANDKPGYYEFEVNAAGAILDMFIPRPSQDGNGKYLKADPFHVEAKVKLRGTLNKHDGKDEGWSVEGRIPWRDFSHTGGRPNIAEAWKFALCRYDYTHGQAEPELSTCAALHVASFHAHEDYATIKFIGPAHTANEIPPPLSDWRPMTTSRVIGTPDPPPPYRAVRTLPKLTPDYPIFVAAIPNSRRLIYIDEDRPYSPARLLLTSDPPGAEHSERLIAFADKGVAYAATFHPKFSENGYLYIGWNNHKQTLVSRYTLEKVTFRIVPDSERTIIAWPSNGHNGGAVAFGRDGMLYVTSGDGTSDSDHDLVGQRLDRFGGKVLRIDVDHPDEGRAYSVPKDNPFVGVKDALPETWAYGLRNPWRITVDDRTGHVWVGNNGQDLWEQAYWIERGANYGWSVQEGSHPFYPGRAPGPTPISPPTFEHPHSEFRSLTGGVVYYGKRFPDLQGCYIYGDYCTGKLWAGKHDGKEVVRHEHLADTGLAITCIAVDADGELLIANHRDEGEGGFYTLERNYRPHDPKAFPRTLSDTGLFRDLKAHVMQPGAIPYSVNAPLWSDGADKVRYVVLPPTIGSPDKPEPPSVEYRHTGGFDFPDHTVLVKSFALNLAEDGSAKQTSGKRWVETRLLVREQGEWVGYSYAWNDSQTDATLVAKEGRDETFSVTTDAGRRAQKWHYPSRTECMVCHSRVANYVLGLSELQLNKEHDYGGHKANQLAVWEALGLFRVKWLDEIKWELHRELTAADLADEQLDEAFDKKLEKLKAAKDQRQPPASKLLFHRPEHFQHLVDPYDPQQDLNLRARSYLHANCAHCHVPTGGGNAQFDVDFRSQPKDAKLIDVRPQHHTFEKPDARLVAAGEPDRSVLLHRLLLRGNGQMPPLASSVVDEPATRMIREWIQALKPDVR